MTKAHHSPARSPNSRPRANWKASEDPASEFIFAPNSRPRANWKYPPAPSTEHRPSPNSRPRANWKSQRRGRRHRGSTPNSRPRANWKGAAWQSGVRVGPPTHAHAQIGRSPTAAVPCSTNPQLTPTRKLEDARRDCPLMVLGPPTHAHAQIGSKAIGQDISVTIPQLTPTRKLEARPSARTFR